MKTVFADTSYWVALLVPDDQWHARIASVTANLGEFITVTTQEVLTELLNFVAAAGPHTRQEVAAWVSRLSDDPTLVVVEQSAATFRAGLEFYGQRSDKAYGLTDCISMVTMRQRGITDALTHDHHFAQEGYVALLRDAPPHR